MLASNQMDARKLFIRTTLLCGILIVLIFGLSLKNIERIPLSIRPLQFNAQNAHHWMTRLSKDFPYRFTYAEPRKKAALWIKNEFAKMGYTPEGMQFSETIGNNRYTDLENIYVVKKGKKNPEQIISFAAHYDIAETTVEGAMDDAAGVGVVMELARLFSKIETDKTLLFLVTDSEELGAFWGAHNFVRQYPNAQNIIAHLNFDFVSPEKQTKILTLCDGLKEGYTPLWLRELAIDSVRSLKTVEALDFINIMEHIERALQIPPADHGEFLAAGIPAFNYVGQTDDFAHVTSKYLHTPEDRAEFVRPESLDDFGKAAERVAYSIDELKSLPENYRNSSYWKVTPDRYIDGWIVTILHILLFVPFLFLTLYKTKKAFKQYTVLQRKAALFNEMKKMGMLIASLLTGYVIMLLLPFLKVIPRYENFPATQKAPLLYNPKAIAFVLVFAGIASVYYLLRKVFYSPTDNEDRSDIRQAVHGILLCIVISFALLKNTYLTTLMLLPPAYFWMSLKKRKDAKGRFINFLLILLGTLSLIAMTLVMSSVFHIGIVYWYLFLGATYGLFSAYAVVIFLIAIALIIRQIRRYVFK